MPTRVEIDQTTRYLPFLVEIRRRLLFLLSLFSITTVLGFIYYERVIRLVLGIFKFEGVNIVFTSPFQFISLAVNTGLLLGLMVIFPLILFQILAFLKPALRPQEFRKTVFLLPLSIFLFTTGFVFGIAIIRYAVLLFYQKSLELNIGNFLDISLFLSQMLITGVLMGIAFQFPVVLTILMRLKVIKYAFLVKQRVFVYSASLVFAALLPPTDLFSLILLFLPLAMLFELTLILNRLVLKSHLL